MTHDRAAPSTKPTGQHHSRLRGRDPRRRVGSGLDGSRPPIDHGDADATPGGHRRRSYPRRRQPALRPRNVCIGPNHGPTCFHTATYRQRRSIGCFTYPPVALGYVAFQKLARIPTIIEATIPRTSTRTHFILYCSHHRNFLTAPHVLPSPPSQSNRTRSGSRSQRHRKKPASSFARS